MAGEMWVKVETAHHQPGLLAHWENLYVKNEDNWTHLSSKNHWGKEDEGQKEEKMQVSELEKT